MDAPPSRCCLSPSASSRLTKIDSMECSSLTVLPESIGQLQALTELSLDGCSSLTALPESIGQLQALTTLYLSE